MRLIIVIFFSVAWVSVGLATVDPDPDQIGMYFDPSADTVCIEAQQGVPFFAYLVITNPTADEIWGIEFGLCTEFIGGDEGWFFKLAEEWSANYLDLGVVVDWCSDGRLVGFVEPVPQVGDNAVLVRLQYMLLSNMTVEFYLGPHSAQSIEDGLPAYLGADNELRSLGVSSGDTTLPVAIVNGACGVVPTDQSSFSKLKRLYR